MRRSFVSVERDWAKQAWASAGAVARLGWAAGVQQLLEGLLFVVVLYRLGLFSATWLAAGTIVFAVMELNYAASGALGEIVAARIARDRARHDGAASMRRLRLGGCLAGAVAGLLACCVVLFPHAVASLFMGATMSEDARSLTATLLRWTAPVFVFDAWQIVFVHALRGYRRVVVPMLVGTGCYWAVGIGGGFVLAEAAGLGAGGTWIGFCAGLAAAAILLGALAFRTAGARARPPP